MKIHEIRTVDGFCVYHWALQVDGKEVMSMQNLNESPEDAMLGREMKDVFKVKDLMRRAYIAGKNGEEFSFTMEEVVDDE